MTNAEHTIRSLVRHARALVQANADAMRELLERMPAMGFTPVDSEDPPSPYQVALADLSDTLDAFPDVDMLLADAAPHQGEGAPGALLAADDALLDYGTHRRGCPAKDTGNPDVTCRCGLDEAQRAIRAAALAAQRGDTEPCAWRCEDIYGGVHVTMDPTEVSYMREAPDEWAITPLIPQGGLDGE